MRTLFQCDLDSSVWALYKAQAIGKRIVSFTRMSRKPFQGIERAFLLPIKSVYGGSVSQMV